MNIYTKLDSIYWQIRNKMDNLNSQKIPYFICDELPNNKAKHQVIALAKKLGLVTDNQDTMRLIVLAPEFNKLGEKLINWFKGKRYEVYMHCYHCKKDYFSAKDSRNMLTLGFYVGS